MTGFTLWDIERLARIAASGHRSGLSADEQRAIAASAIGEAIAAGCADHAELVITARRELAREAYELQRGDGYIHGGTGARFAAYWHGTRDHAETAFEEKVDDTLAARQTWAALSEYAQVVLWALAEHEDHKAAARSLGVLYGTYSKRLSRARREAFELWFWPEDPPPFWGRDNRSGPGQRSRAVKAMRLNRRRHAA